MSPTSLIVMKKDLPNQLWTPRSTEDTLKLYADWADSYEADVASYQLPDRLAVFWSASGNHDLVPPKRSGVSAEDSWAEAAQAVSGFIHDNC